jgi:putative endonuclease
MVANVAHAARARTQLATRHVGAAAESKAVAFLTRCGFRIVERNFRCKVGELDIVAFDGDVLCFVEVRSRANDRCGDAAVTVTYAKQRKVSRAAQAFLCARRVPFREARFDVVAITGDEVALIRDAWRLSRW